ncbi:cGMP-dependent 3',5'-cyclic phosphodiesterase-like isoform X2 [Neodiprion virginianus]|uniref:cGMP-dependent 3',5'-cyclic phosphodiesterase-like isoform X2 n=1 Tax=Neodiprion fabricii TaxID=2872261 RepID=UPI001ED97474|nr:cGMP-dependent 3',5'-cyclic phosphodiesterase-like isoform X2 [Neodiprion fabricii]XP_046612800.1 cGMP-dependent 3',5'-cyclic phosphodiesterase-like isoform X2 [Neodiprion virginianus]
MFRRLLSIFFCDVLCIGEFCGRSRIESKMTSLNLKATDPESILSLLQDLADVPCNVVQQKLNSYLQTATGSKVVFLAPILLETEEMVIHVVGEKILERELRFPVSQSNVLNHVLHRAVKHRKSVTAHATELDQELLQHLHSVVNPVPDLFLSIPIQHPVRHHIALVVCLVNCEDRENAEYMCTKMVQECFKYCLGLLLSTLRCQEETRLKLQCQDLLAVSRKLFTHLGDLSDLLREIMAEARKLTNAERCSLFLLDPEQQDLVAKVFDGISTRDVSNIAKHQLHPKSVKEMRIARGRGIAGHVASSGKLLNIRNAYDHPLFYRGIDEVTGFKTRNILCFPIRDEKGIIGVAQLCNKMDGLYFDVCDEEVATAFSIYCGISIMHSIVYKKIQDAQARNKLSNELMMYHMKVETESVQSFLNCRDDHSIKDFDKFHFSPRSVPYKHMPCYVLKMFGELGFINTWRIKTTTLARFILFVKKGYRDAPYHNWVHAFSVAHFAYLLMVNLNLIKNDYITSLQGLAFLVSCLCHDIDHRGTNNSFQTKCGTVLASLYSSEGSVMERHHLAQSMCILNTDGCNIFESLSSEEYSEVLDLLRNNILSTDLTSHFRMAEQQREMISAGFKKNDPTHRKLLLAMFMTCCDLSDQTKDWRVTKKTAEQIYDEFFSQGDLEKSMGTAPAEMMDRERASIPDLQVQFITNLVLPLFKNLADLFPAAQPLVDTIINNKNVWKHARHLFQEYSQNGTKSMEILLDPTLEDEVLKAFEQSGDIEQESATEMTEDAVESSSKHDYEVADED